jgi:hypothetical protein
MKWRNYRVHLIWQERMYDAPQKLAVPRLINLDDNPQERPEETTGESAVVTHGWILHAMFAQLAKFQASLKQYPPVPMGTSDPYTPAQRTMGTTAILRAGPAVGAAVLVAVAVAAAPKASLADEGGVSFWLTGQFGSLAAVPQQPGCSIAGTFYHTKLSGGGEVAAAREITINKIKRTVNVNLDLDLKARADLVFLSPSYVFASPVLGGQLAVGMAGAYGHNSTALDGILTASVASLTATRPGSITDSRDGVGDLYPRISLRWNRGVNNL